MIDTYQSSVAPPVPPRLGGSQPVLVPAPPPSRGHSKHLIRFLVGVVVAHLFLSVAAFLYLHDKHRAGEQASPGDEDWSSAPASRQASLSSEKRKTSALASAHMVSAKHGSRPKASEGLLQWDVSESALRHINYYQSSWLTILQPGQYYVYSTVTFSRGDPRRPLVSQVKLRDDKGAEEKVAMRASCYLQGGDSSTPFMCTATQGRLMTLQNGNQLSLWVSDLSLVDYADAGTTFGLYKL